MRVRVPSLVCLASLVVLVPVLAFAQDATLIGSVVDSTKAALPGATITATMIDTGRSSTTVTDERGEYRLRGLADIEAHVLLPSDTVLHRGSMAYFQRKKTSGAGSQ